VRAVSRAAARLALLLGLSVLSLGPGCSRGPVRIPRGDGSAGIRDAGAAEPVDGVADGIVADPDATDRCALPALLSRIPRTVAGWTILRSPVYPYEFFSSIPIGFVGRLYRAGPGRCVVVAVARPADRDAALRALAEEQARTIDAHGRYGLTVPARPANQVTTWIRDGDDRLLMLRAFGTIDPDVLAPFLDALYPGAADADGGEDSAADTPEGPPCPPGNPLADPYAPEAFYSPPGDCRI
jgi:hypothetical protein